MEEKQPKKTRKAGKTVTKVIFFVLLFVFLFSSFQIFMYFREGSLQQNVNEQILSQGIRPVQKPDATQTETSEPATQEPQTSESVPPVSTEKQIMTVPDIEVDFDVLKKYYPDMVAWLYTDGTVIHYPVMQSTDNDYYLYRLPNGDENKAGSLFLDFSDNADFSEWIYRIYGHNMQNDTMFGTLLEYRSQTYYDEHPYMFLFTPEKIYRLEIFAGVHTKAVSYVYYKPQNDSERAEYLSQIRKSSVFSSSVKVSVKDQIVILSTCSGPVNGDARFVIAAKMVPIS